MLYLGIDPGLTGALGVIDSDGRYVAVYDTPIVRMTLGKKIKHDYDLPGMAALLRQHANSTCIIERAQAMPGQGVVSMFMIGGGYYAWLAMMATLHISYLVIPAVTWKRAIGLSKDKEQSRLRAQQLFPAADLRLKKFHGRAEALLLARYGWKEYGGRHQREESVMPAYCTPIQRIVPLSSDDARQVFV